MVTVFLHLVANENFTTTRATLRITMKTSYNIQKHFIHYLKIKAIQYNLHKIRRT